MEDVLEIVDLAANAGFAELFAWLFRLVGVLFVLAGVGLWLFTEMGVLWLPAAVVVVGLLLAVPQLLLAVVAILE